MQWSAKSRALSGSRVTPTPPSSATSTTTSPSPASTPRAASPLYVISRILIDYLTKQLEEARTAAEKKKAAHRKAHYF